MHITVSPGPLEQNMNIHLQNLYKVKTFFL